MFIDHNKAVELIVNLRTMADDFRKSAAYMDQTADEIEKELERKESSES